MTRQRQDFCGRGHLLTAANCLPVRRVTAGGTPYRTRECRLCRNWRQREAYARRKSGRPKGGVPC